MKKTRTWILVADGARARILQSEGWGTGLTPVAGQARRMTNPPTREQVSDRPGRVQESASGTRHAIAPRVDWHRYEKHLFAGELAQCYLPGRTPEITDVFLLGAGAVLLKLAEP